MTYHLASYYLTDKECEKLDKPVGQKVLLKYGFNRNTPKDVIHGPSALGGIEMRPLYVEQGVAQLHSLISILRSDTPAKI